MRDDLNDIYIDPAERDARRFVQRDMQRPAPKRFYAAATLAERDGLTVLLLDGKPAHTPARNVLGTARRGPMEWVRDEWAAQGETIQPVSMPATRLVNSAIDGVSRTMDEVRAEIVRYAGSDLVCYRAGEPASLVAEQAAVWDPVLAFARDDLGARLVLAEGVVFAGQPDHALAAITRAVDRFDDPVALAALSTMTTLTGSALLALMVAQGRWTGEAAWAAAHVDEDHQMRAWGLDAEALERRDARWREMAVAAALARA